MSGALLESCAQWLHPGTFIFWLRGRTGGRLFGGVVK